MLLLKPVTVLPSAGRTHAGTWRKTNEDALLLRPDLALWAVADGVGGHEDSAAARKTVIEHLGRMLPPLSFGSAAEEIGALLREANTALQQRANLISDHVIVASTVVVLLIYAGHYCVIWSGDSRAYRLRGNRLEPLTRDHSAPCGGATDGTMVTHAIRASAEAYFDTVHGAAEPDDRFLLCGDGVTKILDEVLLADMLAGP